MRSKAFYISKMGLGCIGNSALVCRKKLILICKLGCVRGIMYFIIKSALLDYVQLPILNSYLLHQASLPYVKFSDCCHSAQELG